jgi:hypothetical protein
MITRFALAAIAVLTLALVGVTRFGLDVAEATPQNAAPQSAPQQGMQDMMKMHEQMMAEMKVGDAKLDALVKEMNAATGQAKVNAVAAVVNELVQQHRAMHGHMGQMHEHMMGMGRGMMGR